MQQDLDQILAKSITRRDRLGTSLYLSKSIYQDFQAVCAGLKLTPSRVFEEFMYAFVNQKREKKRASK